MGFRFIHTADWQLAKPFTRFGVELNAKLQDARLKVIDRIAEIGRREGVSHVLVAGDVWDQQTPTDAALLKPLEKMGAAETLNWWLLPGNHDPADGKAGSLWQRLADFGLPPNVHPLTTPEPVMIEAGIALLPAPWSSKRPGRDLTLDFGERETPLGAMRLGLAHGGVEGFGSEAEEAIVIDPARAEQADLRYLALGDWHGARRAGPRAWYPGTPEPDGFRETDQGKILVVDTDAPEEPVLKATGDFDWLEAAIACDPTLDLGAALSALVPEREDLSQRLLRLNLIGNISLGAHRVFDQLWQRSEARLAFAELRSSELSVLSSTDDLDAALGQGGLRNVAERLGAHEDDAVRQEALLLLHGFADRVRR